MSDSTVATTSPICQVFSDPIPFIIPYGSLNYMAGASGTGKTIIMADWLARMRDGRSICGHSTNKPTDFYYLAADRDWSTFARAFKNAGFPEIKRYVLAEDKDFDPRNWRRTESFKFLERCMNLLNPIAGALVIIDPGAPLFVQGKSNDSWDVAISSHYFRQIARHWQITLIVTANVAKQRADDGYVRPQDRIAGSGAFVAYADTQIYLDRDEKGALTLGWVPRLARAEEFHFEFDEVTCLFRPAAVDYTIASLPDIARKIWELIPAEGETTSHGLVQQVIAQLGYKRSVVFKWLKALIDQWKLVERCEHGVIRRRKPTIQ